MTALPAMTLPSTAPTPASSARDSQTSAQTDPSRGNDFDSTLQHATHASSPVSRKPTQADTAPQETTVSTEAELLNTDTETTVNKDPLTDQLAYLQAPVISPPQTATKGESRPSPEIEVLNQLGQALSQTAADSGETEAAGLLPQRPDTSSLLPERTRFALHPSLAEPVTLAASLSANLNDALPESLVATEAAGSVRAPDASHLGIAPLSQTATTQRSPDLPQVPGPATPLQPQALQQRMDEALRWMVGQGVQAAQVRIAPEALGPITIHLQMHGEQASVAFVSAVDTTRQALEANLATLKEALNQQGFNLEQTFVGDQEQHAAAQQEAQQQRQTSTTLASAGETTVVSASVVPAAPTTPRGLVDTFA